MSKVFSRFSYPCWRYLLLLLLLLCFSYDGGLSPSSCFPPSIILLVSGASSSNDFKGGDTKDYIHQKIRRHKKRFKEEFLYNLTHNNNSNNSSNNSGDDASTSRPEGEEESSSVDAQCGASVPPTECDTNNATAKNETVSDCTEDQLLDLLMDKVSVSVSPQGGSRHERRREEVRQLLDKYPDWMRSLATGCQKTITRTESSKENDTVAEPLDEAQARTTPIAPMSSSLLSSVTLIFIEPSGYIGYGSTLSPLILVGLFPPTVHRIIVDGVEMTSFTVTSDFSIHLSYVPAHPEPPSTLFYRGSHDLAPEPAVTPVVIEFIIPVTENGVEKNVSRSVVLDGVEGRPLLARHTEYTPVIRYSVGYTSVMQDSAPFLPSTTYRVANYRDMVNNEDDDGVDGSETFSVEEKINSLSLMINDIWVVNSSDGQPVALNNHVGTFYKSNKTKDKVSKLRLSQMLLVQEKKSGISSISRDQQEEESVGVQRYSAQIDSFTFSPVRVLSANLFNLSFNDIYGSNQPQSSRASGIRENKNVENSVVYPSSGIDVLSLRYLFGAQLRVSSTESFASNASLLWSTGQITGDLTTSTVTTSVVPKTSEYALYRVLPVLNKAAMFQSLASALSIDYGGIRFSNEDGLFGDTYHYLRIKTVLPRKVTKDIVDQVGVKLHRLRMPTLSEEDYPFVPNLVDQSNRCIINGMSSTQIECFVEYYPEFYPWSEEYWSDTWTIDPLETCGSGTVVRLFLSNQDGENVLLDPFPVVIPSPSLYFVKDLIQLYPDTGRRLLSSYLALIHQGSNTPMFNVTLQYTYIYVNVYSGTYRVHCYGDGYVRVDATVQTYPSTGVQEKICEVHSGVGSLSHIRSNFTFTYSAVVSFNVTCVYPLDHILKTATSDTASCGVSLEMEELFSALPANANGTPRGERNESVPRNGSFRFEPLSSSLAKDVSKEEEEETMRPLSNKLGPYMLLQIESPYQTDTSVKNISETIFVVETVDGVETKHFMGTLEALFTEDDCREPGEDFFKNSNIAISRVSWGAGGAIQASFSKDQPKVCLMTIALQLNHTNQCDRMELLSEVPGDTPSSFKRLTLDRFYCGSQSFYLDPISPHQIRVPLTEVPHLVELDEIIKVPPTDNTVFQYCVEVLIDDKEVGVTAAAVTEEGPLIYSLIDTKHSKTHYFLPYVYDTVPVGGQRGLRYGERLLLLGSDLMYRLPDSTALSGSLFLMHLAEMEYIGVDNCMIYPDNRLPTVLVNLVNDSTLALPIDDKVPGGWFNFTMTSGYVGEVWVECDLSFQVFSTPVSVFNADISDLNGGTPVEVHGHNMPLNRVRVFLGGRPPSSDDSSSSSSSSSSGSSSSESSSAKQEMGTTPLRIECVVGEAPSTTVVYFTTPSLTLEEVEELSYGFEEGTGFHMLPIIIEVSLANGTVFQTMSTFGTEGGESWFYVAYNLASFSVTSIHPKMVSSMNPNPQFTIEGTQLSAKNILICNAQKECVSCIPITFSTQSIECGVSIALSAGNYSLYLSDRPNYPAPNITIQSTASLYSISPKAMYVYGGAEVRITGENLYFYNLSLVLIRLLAGPNAFYERDTYYVSIKDFGEDFVSFTAPDFSEVSDTSYIRAELVYWDGMELTSLRCTPPTACRAQILSRWEIPVITSIYPIQGQAPLLITVNGFGFTMLPHSPNISDSYVDVGSGPCRILDILNTGLVCQLEQRCSNNYAYSSLHIVSGTYGRSSPYELNGNLFFYCTMSIDAISHSRGSTTGGQHIVIEGSGFPTARESLEVTVAGLECSITFSTAEMINCTTSPTLNGGSLEGTVKIRNRATDNSVECCHYKYDPEITPVIKRVAPLFGIGLSHTSIYGYGFLGTYRSNEQQDTAKGTARAQSELFDCSLDPQASKVQLYVLFGTQLLPASVLSDTCARLIFPENLYGTAVISLYNPEVGFSLPYTEGELSVNMLPAIVLPSSGGFSSGLKIRLIGTTMVNLTVDINTLIYVNVCGKRCTITGTTEYGEVECTVPFYLDVDFILNRYAASFATFPTLLSGYRVHYWAPSFTSSLGLYLSGLSSEWGRGSLFLTENPIPSSPIRSRFVYVLEAEMHSRLILSSITITLSPVTNAQIDFSNASCRLQLAKKEAENYDLFSTNANPSNSSMWDSTDVRYWPPLSVGENTLTFSSSLPVGSYILITCSGLPDGALQLKDAKIKAYQVGLHDSDGVCPVDMVSQQTSEQSATHSCPSRSGQACATFRYEVDSTPTVTEFSPSFVLASARNSIVKIKGANLGHQVSDIAEIVLNSARCEVVSVSPSEITCSMLGFVSTQRNSYIGYTNASLGKALFLASQPFYATTGWSSFNSWMRNYLPQEGQLVYIGENSSVLLDTSPPPLMGIVLDGVLVVSDDADIELTLNRLIIGPKGSLVVGVPSLPHKHRFTLNMHRVTNLAEFDDITSMKRSTDDPPGDKLIYVNGGSLQMHGKSRLYEKAYLLHDAMAGDRSVVVNHRVDWEIGDQFLITSPSVFVNDEEVGLVASLTYTNDTTTIGLRYPLNYTHRVYYGRDPPFEGVRPPTEETQKTWEQFTQMSAYRTSEVLLLTRNVKIQGDAISATSGIGASLWIKSSTTSHFSNVEFYRMGKRGTLSDYAVFYDTCLYSYETSLLEGCVIHESYNRGVVLSQTENAVVDRIITSSIEGFAVAAIGTYHQRLTVKNSYLCCAKSTKGSTDTSVANVFLTYPDVKVVNNIIRLSEGHGVWYSLRNEFANSAVRTCPTTVPLNDFSNNTIFSFRQQGLLIYPIHQALSRTCASNVFNKEVLSDAFEISAGTIENSTIFTGGACGVLLPFSSGYQLTRLAIADCNEASLWTSFSTSTLQINQSLLYGSLPGGEVSDFPSVLVRKQSLLQSSNTTLPMNISLRVGLHSLHGGYLNLIELLLGNFSSGTALWLATSTSQPSFSVSYTDGVDHTKQQLYMLHNSVLSVTLSSVQFLGFNKLTAVLGRRANVHDIDGVLSGQNVDTYIMSSTSYLRNTSYCNLTDLQWLPPVRVYDEAVHLFSFTDFWQTIENSNRTDFSDDAMICYGADRNFMTFSVKQELNEEELILEKQLQENGGDTLWCSNVTIEVRYEGGLVSFSLDLFPSEYLKPSDRGRLPAASVKDGSPGAALFLFLANRFDALKGDSVDSLRGNPITNASFYFKHMNGTACFPKLFWYTGSGFTQNNFKNVMARVNIDTSYWMNITADQWEVVWYSQEIRKVVNGTSVFKQEEPSPFLPTSREGNGETVVDTDTDADSTLSASSSDSISNAEAATDSSDDSSASGPQDEGTVTFYKSTYASINLHFLPNRTNETVMESLLKPQMAGGLVSVLHCEEGGRCIDSIMPSLNEVSNFQRPPNEPYTDWFSSSAWMNGCAPWLLEQETLSPEEAFILRQNVEQVYTIEMKQRVKLTSNATVPGTLFIIGELLIEGKDGEKDPIVLRAESVVVFGNLTIRSRNATSQKIRVEVGYVSAEMVNDSTRPTDCTSRLPLRVSYARRVFCGQLLLIGRIQMLGRLTPTVFTAEEAMMKGSNWVPRGVAKRNESVYKGFLVNYLMEYGLSGVNDTVSAVDEYAWLAGDRLGVTSSSSNWEEAEVVTAVSDGVLERMEANRTASSVSLVTTPFKYAHGYDEAKFSARSEVAVLSKNIELLCLITTEQSERNSSAAPMGCSISLIYSVLLNQTSNFTSIGVAVRGFGRGGQYRKKKVSPTRAKEDTKVDKGYITDYMYDKEQFIPAMCSIGADSTMRIVSTVFIDGYGPAVYANNTRGIPRTAMVFLDSVVWNSQGGGIRVDSGYQYLLLSTNTTTELTVIDSDQSVSTNVIGRESVQVYIYYALVTGTTYYRDKRREDPYENLLSLCSIMANGTNIEIVESVAGGSEGEGFCGDWRAGAIFRGNVAHSNVNGIFLFTSELLSVLYSGQGGNLLSNWMDATFAFNNVTAYDNSFSGLYSSSHINITVVNSTFFENTMSTALSVSSYFSRGIQFIQNTLLGCPTSEEGWKRMSPVSMKVWCPGSTAPGNRCDGGIDHVFLRESLHCAAVSLLPSFGTIGPSYNRTTPVTIIQNADKEYPTSAQYSLTNVTLVGIGDSKLVGKPMQGAVFGAIAGVSSSASIYEVSSKNTVFVDHPNVTWTKESVIAVTNGPYSFQYADTVFYDLDGSLFSSHACNYLISRSTIRPLCETQDDNPTIIACCDIPFVQIRIRSLDDRQAPLNQMNVQYVYTRPDGRSVSMSMGARALTYSLSEGLTCETSSIANCNSNASATSFAQVYKTFPRSTIRPLFDPTTYPDTFVVGIEACLSRTPASDTVSAPFTKVRVKMMDQSKTVTMWNTNVSIPPDIGTGADDGNTTAATKWYITKIVNPIDGTSESFIDILLHCGSGVVVHQASYGELLIYSNRTTIEVERQLIQWNNNAGLFSSSLVKSPDSRLVVAPSKSFPDPHRPSSSYIYLRFTLRDSYQYNVSEACEVINGFLSQFRSLQKFSDVTKGVQSAATGGNLSSFHIGETYYEVAGVFQCQSPYEYSKTINSIPRPDAFYVWHGSRLIIFVVIMIVAILIVFGYNLIKTLLHRKFLQVFSNSNSDSSSTGIVSLTPTASSTSRTLMRNYTVEDGIKQITRTVLAVPLPNFHPPSIQTVLATQSEENLVKYYCHIWRVSPVTSDALVERSRSSAKRSQSLGVRGWIVPPAPLTVYSTNRSQRNSLSSHDTNEGTEREGEDRHPLIPIDVRASAQHQTDPTTTTTTTTAAAAEGDASVSSHTSATSGTPVLRNSQPVSFPTTTPPPTDSSSLSPVNAPVPTPILASRYTGTAPTQQRGAVTILAPMEDPQERPSMFEDGARRRWINSATGLGGRMERPERPSTPMILQTSRKRMT